MNETIAAPSAMRRSGRHARSAERRPVVEAVEADAASEGFVPRWTWAVSAFPALAVFLFAAAIVYRPAYQRMLEEDYPVEWLQFTCIMFASALAVITAVRFARKGQWFPAVVLVAFALGWFLLGGEEISWGQRVIGIATPESLESVNAQGELGLHNITNEGGVDIEAVFRQLQTVIAVAGTFLPLLTRLRRPVLRGAIWRLLSPPLFLIPLFIPMWVYRALTMTVLKGEWHFSIIRFQEWVELCQYLGIAVMVLCLYVGIGRVAGSRRDRVQLAGPMQAVELRLPVILAGLLLAITLVFAVLTLFSGVTAGNAG